MPVTAKLSKRFYERLGDEIANELVDWMNQVDAAYKSDIREINDANFARFEAKLDQRIGELRSDMHAMEARLDAKVTVSVANLASSVDRTLRGQTRFLYFAWAAVLAVVVPLWFRH
jgi:hypothetical protein